MTYIEAFQKIKAEMMKSAQNEVEGHLAIQVNITDSDAAGIFYIEVNNGNLYVEPFDYVDNDAVFSISVKDMLRLVTGKMTYERAIESGALTVSGNLEKGALIKKITAKSEEPVKTEKEVAGDIDKAVKKKVCGTKSGKKTVGTTGGTTGGCSAEKSAVKVTKKKKTLV